MLQMHFNLNTIMFSYYFNSNFQKLEWYNDTNKIDNNTTLFLSNFNDILLQTRQTIISTHEFFATEHTFEIRLYICKERKTSCGGEFAENDSCFTVCYFSRECASFLLSQNFSQTYFAVILNAFFHLFFHPVPHCSALLFHHSSILPSAYKTCYTSSLQRLSSCWFSQQHPVTSHLCKCPPLVL